MKFTKRLLPIVVACVLALGLASQALAAPTPSASHQAFTCLGKVSSASSSGVTITVERASLALQGSLGQSLTLTATNSSVLSLVSHGSRTPVAAAAVPVGDLVAASGAIDVTTGPGTTLYDITRAVVWQPRAQTHFLCRGTVSSVVLQPQELVVTVARGSLGLRGSQGAAVTIDVPANVKILAQQGRRPAATTFNQITAGDRVTITGTADRSDPSAPVFTARRVEVRHVVAAAQLKWFACLGKVSSTAQTTPATITVTVKRGTRAVRSDIGGDLTLTVTASSVIRTLSDGVVTTVPAAEVTSGESVLVTGTIDRSVPASPVYDIGQAFVWQPVANS